MLTSLSISDCKCAKALNNGLYRHTNWKKFRQVWEQNNCPSCSICTITVEGKEKYFCTFYVGDFLWFSPFGSWKTVSYYDLPF